MKSECASWRDTPVLRNDPLLLRLYLFIRKNDPILFLGGSVVAFMIGSWTGVGWWLLTQIVIAIGIPLWMFVWYFFRACFWPTREMKEAMLRASEEEEEEERARSGFAGGSGSASAR